MFESLICFGLGILLGCCFGYALTVRDGLLEIEKVITKMEHLDNHYVEYSIYKDLQDKYEDTVKEYEQYKGCIKALKDFKGVKL